MHLHNAWLGQYGIQSGTDAAFDLPLQRPQHHSQPDIDFHFIPANVQVTRELMRVESGDTVRFRGYLVEISSMDGWKWRSSLTRNDTGNGACELVLVDDLTVFKDS